MNPAARNRFDKVLEEVLAEMPPMVHRLLDEVALVVEDYPSKQIIAEMGLEYRDDLCGLYTGIPLDEKRLEAPPHLSDEVLIYREGIVASAADADKNGRVTRAGLREQIRVTILHELAHHHGMTEEELEDLGYG
jgi:predicted Zn-dependent protease with MMP-like domain